MLGVRLSEQDDQALARFAKRSRRSKSDIAREAVQEYLRRHTLDEEWRRQVANLRGKSLDGEDAALLDAVVDDLSDDPPSAEHL